MANTINKQKARTHRMQHRKEVRQRSAAMHLVAVVRFAALASGTSQVARLARLEMVTNAAQAMGKVAVSLQDEQPALTEFIDYGVES